MEDITRDKRNAIQEPSELQELQRAIAAEVTESTTDVVHELWIRIDSESKDPIRRKAMSMIIRSDHAVPMGWWPERVETG